MIIRCSEQTESLIYFRAVGSSTGLFEYAGVLTKFDRHTDCALQPHLAGAYRQYLA